MERDLAGDFLMPDMPAFLSEPLICLVEFLEGIPSNIVEQLNSLRSVAIHPERHLLGGTKKQILSAHMSYGGILKHFLSTCTTYGREH